MLVRELAGPAVEWTATEHLLAALIDVGRQGNWIAASVHTPKNKQTKPPQPIPRPGDRKKRKATTDDIAARLVARRRQGVTDGR